MKIILKSEEMCCPSLSALGELGIAHNVKADGTIEVLFDGGDFSVVENKDFTSTEMESHFDGDKSLSYFVIQGVKLVASGDLTLDENGDYVCEDKLRVFSKENDYFITWALSGQNDVSELIGLAGKMIESTNTPEKSK